MQRLRAYPEGHTRIPLGICVEAKRKSRLSGTSAATSAHPAIRNVWWNSGSGSAWMSSRRPLPGILSEEDMRKVEEAVKIQLGMH